MVQTEHAQEVKLVLCTLMVEMVTQLRRLNTGLLEK